MELRRGRIALIVDGAGEVFNGICESVNSAVHRTEDSVFLLTIASLNMRETASDTSGCGSVLEPHAKSGSGRVKNGFKRDRQPPTFGARFRRMSHKIHRHKGGDSGVIGYARVSTRDQSLDAQLSELARAGCCRVYAEHVSSVAHREGWAALLSEVRAGDTVCVVRLDRIGRRLVEVVQACATLTELGAFVRALAQGIDTRDASGRVILPIWAALAETERAILLERTHEGLRAAREKGRFGGRPSLRNPAKDALIAHLRSQGHSLRAIARETSVSEGTVRRSIAAFDAARAPEKRQTTLDLQKKDESE